MEHRVVMEEVAMKHEANVQPRKVFQCYKREWEKLPIFKDWLTPVPGNRHKAYCKFCKKQFRAHRTDLRSHARSRKHQKAGDAYFSDSMAEDEPHHVTVLFREEYQNSSVAGRSDETIADDEMEDGNNEIEESYTITENHEDEEEEEQELNETTDKILETNKNVDSVRENVCKASGVSQALGKESESSMTVKGISTQVLDLVRGLPVSRLGVTLLLECGSTWSKVSDGVTDGKGHCTLLKPQEVVQGRYKINYEVKKYFTLGLHDTIYPFIEVTFDVADLQDDYHVPLLLSPCGYMVYRVR